MPSTPTDRLQGLTTSVAVKPPCIAVTNAAITLNGEQTVNGVAVHDGDRVLVANQVDQTTNGIYVASTGVWVRAQDFDGVRDAVFGTLVVVVSASGQNILYRVTCMDDPIVFGTSLITFAVQQFVIPSPRGYIAGLVMSTTGGSGTLTIAAGQATDSTNLASISLAAPISKGVAPWTVGSGGSGGLDTGSIAASTWYHFYVIERTDTAVVDALFSLSASAPTMPSGYTLKRRIGSAKTDGSFHWTAFIQDGNSFQWSTPVQDVSVTNPGNTAVTRTLTVPTGVNVKANVQVFINTATGNIAGFAIYLANAFLSDLACADVQPGITGLGDTGFVGGTATAGFPLSVTELVGSKTVRTNTSAQIRSRLSNSDATTGLIINTLGWEDGRGRDA